MARGDKVNVGKERPPRGERPPGATSRASAESGKDAAPPVVRLSPADRKLATSIAGTYQMVGGLTVGIAMRTNDEGLGLVGVKTIETAEQLGEQWVVLANQNPKVKDALRKFTEVSAAGTLAMMHVSLIIPLLVQRGVIPQQFAVMMDDNAAAAAASENGGTAHT